MDKEKFTSWKSPVKSIAPRLGLEEVKLGVENGLDSIENLNSNPETPFS